MTNIIIQKIDEYKNKLLDNIIIRLDGFEKRMEAMGPEIAEMRISLDKGEGQQFEERRKKLIEQTKKEYLMMLGIMKETKGFEETSTKILKQEEQKNGLAKKIHGNNLNPKDLAVYIEQNQGNDKVIAENIIGKQIMFKGHKLPIRGYEQEKILIERLGSVEIKNLAKALELYVINIDGIDVSEAIHMITETTNEQELKQFFKNKILKHKKYDAKIWDYQDRKFNLIIRADNKFIHGWVYANKPALDKAVEILSKYSKEHIQVKLDKVQPFGIRSLAQIESMSPEKRKKFLEALPKWRQFSKADAELIKDAAKMQLEYANQ
jgi:hypothetical protein